MYIREREGWHGGFFAHNNKLYHRLPQTPNKVRLLTYIITPIHLHLDIFPLRGGSIGHHEDYHHCSSISGVGRGRSRRQEGTPVFSSPILPADLCVPRQLTAVGI